MTYSYFPGCTLKDRAKRLDICAHKSAEALGIELKELPEWQCCGAVYPQAKDEIGSRLPAIWALTTAENNKLVTMCSACYHVLKRADYDWNRDEDFRTKVCNYLTHEPHYDGSTNVLHFLEVLRDDVGFDEIKNRVVKPLTGRKIGAFYGCMLLRPGKVLAFDDPENPKIIEDFIRALGAEPVKYSYRNECCGSYVALEDKSSAETQVDRAIKSALDAGCTELTTACPLCMYNLVENATENKIPVTYFTELLAEALGVKED